MLSPSFSSPNVSFNLSQPLSPSSLPLFTKSSLRKSPCSSKLYDNTNSVQESRYPYSSFKLKSSLDSSGFSEGSDSGSVGPTLSSSLLAVWLRSCRSLRDVKRVHSIILRRFRVRNTYLFNNLICVYIKYGELSHARNVFDEIPEKNVVTWTAIIDGYSSHGLDEEALKLFVDSAVSGIRPNEMMFVCALGLRDFELGRQLHAAVVKTRRRNLIVDSAVVKLYAQGDDLTSAFRAFEAMPAKDVVTWTTMITACSQLAQGDEALLLFARMVEEGFTPNEFAICAALKASGESSGAGVALGRQIHAVVAKRVCPEDVFVGTALIDMYAKSGEISDSRKVFDRMLRRNTATWTSVISGYAHEGPAEEALVLLREMTRRRVAGNSLTAVSALRACGAVGARAFMAGREVHARVVKGRSELDPRVACALVWFYCRCREFSVAGRVLWAAPVRDVAVWTAMVSGLASGGSEHPWSALGAVRAMGEDGVGPNEMTLASVLKACARLGASRDGQAVHSVATKSVDPPGPGLKNVFVGSALIHMYTKCGQVEEATRVFEGMAERNLVAWRSMVVGLARNGQCREAMKLLYRMQAEGFKVDEYVRTFVLNACSGECGGGGAGDCWAEHELEEVR